MPDSGNQAHLKEWLDAVAEAAASKTALALKAQQLSEPKETPVPPLIKWLVGAIGAFGSTAIIGLGIWLVTSVSTMSNTLARMDERMKGQDTTQINRDAEQDRRIGTLETYHKEGAR